MFPWILCGATLLWALAVTFLWLVNNPLPFPDWGHRCFAVPNENAARTVAQILSNTGNGERFTFDPGETHQTLLADNTTVLIQHDPAGLAKRLGLPPNAISVPVANPMFEANRAVAALMEAGFTANAKCNILPEIKDKFVLVTSNAFDGWVLAFRRHILKMGGKPKTRRIT